MINKTIIEILKPLNIPVTFQKYTGKAETYITFHEYLTSGEAYEEDEEALIGHYIQIDIWSKGDYTVIVKEAKEKLRKAGFRRLNESDLYEEDTKIYHKGLKFYYLEEGEMNA
ncbi:hypothetical protein [Clostridium polynesiense]|uniref:hypothetical protein n=1 Tax=Clostridium polynesiense TaxID=1325933 RepID=UPI00058B59E9|nr:hypothetical protein [Clostridium polynesiense]